MSFQKGAEGAEVVGAEVVGAEVSNPQLNNISIMFSLLSGEKLNCMSRISVKNYILH